MRYQFIEADLARHAFHRLSLSQVAQKAGLLTDSGKAAQRHYPSMLASAELWNLAWIEEVLIPRNKDTTLDCGIGQLIGIADSLICPASFDSSENIDTVPSQVRNYTRVDMLIKKIADAIGLL